MKLMGKDVLIVVVAGAVLQMTGEEKEREANVEERICGDGGLLFIVDIEGMSGKVCERGTEYIQLWCVS